MRVTWERPEPEGWRLRALDKLGPDGRTNKRTQIVTPWAPDGAKKREFTHTLFLFKFLLFKNSIASVYHHPHAQPPPVHHNFGFEAEENGKTDRVSGIRKTSYDKTNRKVSSRLRKLTSEQPQGSGASAYQAESRLRSSTRSTAAKVRETIIYGMIISQQYTHF